MFKKLAHNSTIPSLGGNKALRPLQDLITAEKAIISSLALFSAHFSRASEALRNWGHGEGDDLSDTLGASTKLLLEFSLSIKQFAAHEQTIREHMKAVRTQEENLDVIKTRRRTVGSKADSAERKLNKMDSSHKDAPGQSALLERLRDEIRVYDSEIMSGEANLGDLKRSTTKAWMALKFGGLQECCRKGLIVAETGNLIMAELPQAVTEPGSARPFYTGNTRTEVYLEQAMRALGEVSFSIDASAPAPAPAPVPVPLNHMQYPQVGDYQEGDPSVIHSALPDNESITSLSRGALPSDIEGLSQYRTRLAQDAPRPSLGERGEHGGFPATLQVDELGAFPPQPDGLRIQQAFGLRKPPPSLSPTASLRDDVPSWAQQVGSINSSGGRFAAFPVRGRQDSIAPRTAEPPSDSRTSLSDGPSRGDVDESTPRYEAIDGAHTPLAPPPGAAPPAMPSYYGGYEPGTYDSGPSFTPDNTGDEDDSQLPYMGSPRGERRVPYGSRPSPMARPWSYLNGLNREAESVEEPNGRAPTATEPDSSPNLAQAQSGSIQGESTPRAVVHTPLSQDRAPTPPPAVEDLDDEQALNAAAREVSRELDSLMYQPPPIPKDLPAQPPSPAPLNIPPVAHSPLQSSSDSGSPSAPRSSTDQPLPSNVPPSPRVASPSSSPTSQAQLPPPNITLPRSASPSLSGFSSPPYRTPPELPPSPVSSQRTLPLPLPMSPPLGRSSPLPRSGAGMISVAAFRRPPPRTGSDLQAGSRDVSPLSVRKRDLQSSPNAPRMSGTSSSTSAQPAEPLQQEQNQDDGYEDYISAYLNTGEDDPGSPPAYNEPRARSGSLR
ncbi:hypothetical protein BC826DRAFT_1020605 [Russula brevipes]|nr:hypothetical protein BC826DRAFT_1020605 [Russula brevipes]